MGKKITDEVNSMFSLIGAMQTLVENFPMNFIPLGGLNYACSFDVLSILFKILGVDRQELIEEVTNALCGNINDTTDGDGFISKVENIVKVALETNIINILNCTTNPIISNNLLDYYKKNDINSSLYSGDGITLNVSEIDFTGVLNKNPFSENGKKFYFDVDDKNANTLCESKDFNAFLWYIINKSDKTQEDKLIWCNRYVNDKEIIKCTYIDSEYTNSDKIKVQICGARNGKPANYYKTRKVLGNNTNIAVNKTIFEFNHDFLMSIKLYEPKVIIAEIVEYLLGEGNATVNFGLSLNESLIQNKINEIIRTIINNDDMNTDDCYYSFSNEQYNNMLEESEKNRYNVICNGTDYYEINTETVLNGLNGLNSNSTLNDYKNKITETFNEISVSSSKLNVAYDFEFELIRALVYPFVRPLFTPKVIFLLLLNNKIMGSVTDTDDEVKLNTILDDLRNGIFNIIKDIIVKIKDLIIELLSSFAFKKLKPLLQLFASRLLMESLQIYKDLLERILISIKMPRNRLYANIDDVDYADIIQTIPNKSEC